MAQHRTGSEEELWKRDWFYYRPGIHCIMSYCEFKTIKAGLHFQADNQDLDRGPGQDPFLKKISILLEMLQMNFM